MRSLLWLLLLAVPAQAREGIRGEGDAWRDGRFELGPRLVHLTLTDPNTEESLAMGGLGIYARFRFTRRLGIEGAIDAVTARQRRDNPRGQVERLAGPATLSGLFYFFPESRFQLYLLVGLGLTVHEVRYEALGTTLEYETPAFVSGFGATYRTDSVRFDLSLRSLVMHEDADDMKVTLTQASDRAPTDYAPRLATRDLQGGMLSLGVHWGW